MYLIPVKKGKKIKYYKVYKNSRVEGIPSKEYKGKLTIEEILGVLANRKNLFKKKNTR